MDCHGVPTNHAGALPSTKAFAAVFSTTGLSPNTGSSSAAHSIMVSALPLHPHRDAKQGKQVERVGWMELFLQQDFGDAVLGHTEGNWSLTWGRYKEPARQGGLPYSAACTGAAAKSMLYEELIILEPTQECVQPSVTHVPGEL